VRQRRHQKSIMNSFVTFFHLIMCAACVSCTLNQDASQIFQSAGASLRESVASKQDTSIRSLRSFTPLLSGSLATNEYYVTTLYNPPSTTCNEFIGAISYETNVCIPGTIIDATSTEFFSIKTLPNGVQESTYSDESCMSKIKMTATDFHKTCFNNSMNYNTPTFAIPYTGAHVEIR
jgi:hypothetical protein